VKQLTQLLYKAIYT